MPTKPMKLQTAAMAIAWFGFIARVPTTVAMALGASVAPLTMVAPNVSTTISASTGSLTIAAANVMKSTCIRLSSFLPAD